MRVTEDGDRLNNYANEPKAYAAEPMKGGQRILVAVVSLLLLVGLVAIATYVS